MEIFTHKYTCTRVAPDIYDPLRKCFFFLFSFLFLLPYIPLYLLSSSSNFFLFFILFSSSTVILYSFPIFYFTFSLSSSSFFSLFPFFLLFPLPSFYFPFILIPRFPPLCAQRDALPPQEPLAAAEKGPPRNPP